MKRLAPLFERRMREAQSSTVPDLFGMAPKLAGAALSAAGRPRLPIRLMVGLLYLKHAYNESDESVCERWARRTCTFSFSAVSSIFSHACRVIRAI
ncbi:transposase-like protein DUF772 [Mycetohabitans endofungorum]|uniref:Transposase-like protein DUF772 n=1 Tax=Mycetohabitans endofungorum TaxID=417203 RepID=A0A2P5KBQ6_9BURK|nr:MULTISPECIES: transposase [Mycetohabitans]PPB84150.1 transposase-like protein DUF772 [Mycetohabitans endofungorum]